MNLADMDYRQWIGLSAFLAGLIVVAIDIAQGDVVFAAIVFAIITPAFGGLVWWTQPGRGGPHISHAEAQAAASDRDVIVYWRPG